MITLRVRKIICRIIGHRGSVSIQSYKKRRLRNGKHSYVWDVNRVVTCTRCGSKLEKKRLYRNLNAQEFLKMYAYEESN